MLRRRDIWLHDFYPLVDPLVFRAKCNKTDARPALGCSLSKDSLVSTTKSSTVFISLEFRARWGLGFFRKGSAVRVRIVERVGERHV
jgi:hypothetical protein